MIQRHVWAAIRKASDILDDPGTPADVVLRAVHAISGACNAWTRAHEQYQLAQDVADLRAAVERMGRDRGLTCRPTSRSTGVRKGAA